MSAILTVAVLVFPDVEPLDVAGPFEVLAVAGELIRADGLNVPAPQPELIGAGPGLVRARYGMILAPETSLERPVAPDWVVVPGGEGSRAVAEDERVLGWLRGRVGRSRRIMSVCTGARVLAAAGLLEGRRATTHASAIDELRRRVPSARVDPTARWTREDPIWTSAGVTAGIDMSLAAVADLAGVGLAERVAEHLEHPWMPED
jgi:transcriptional regulator GlxA family with amidase domain